MKKYLYTVLAAGMLLVTSCTQDQWVDVTKGEGQLKTFRVELPGVQSRYIDNGVEVSANKLIYAMYEQGKYDEALITEFVVDDDKDGVFEVTLPMAKKVTYDILFMAYDPENCAFVINDKYAEKNDLREVELRDDLWANQKQYDAFVGRLINQDINSAENSLPLYRPFAQVNVATTMEDLIAIQALKSEVTHSDFLIEDAPYMLDIFDGSVSGSIPLHYEASQILTSSSTYPYNEVITVDGTDYYYLGMSYVLAGETPSAHDVKLNFYSSDDDIPSDDEIISDLDVYSMPVQANYRTNIVGTILTQDKSYQISLSPLFDQPDNGILANKADVSTFEELQVAVDAASVGVPTFITLWDNIIIGSRSLSGRASDADNITISAGKNIILELNGKTIRQEKECTASYEMICNKGTLTIKDSSESGNGKISFKDTSAGDPTYGWGSYTVRNEGTLVVEGGKIEHLGEQESHMICAIFQYSGSTTIHGGTISTPNYRSARLWSGDMIINGGTFEGQLWLQAVNNTADLTIHGGTFDPRGNDSSSVFVTNSQYDVKFAVTGGTFVTKIGCSDASKLAGCISGGRFTNDAKEKTHPVLFNDDYDLVESDGYWTLQKKSPVAMIGDNGYTTLQKALNVGGEIILLQDITLAETVVLAQGKTAVLNLNGKTLSHIEESAQYAIRNLGTLTITGNGTVNARGIYNGYVAEGDPITTAKLTIEDGTFNAKGTNGGAAVFNYGICDINGGKFESYGGYGLNNQATGVMTIDGAEVRGGLYNCGEASIGGTSIYQHISGRHAIYNWSGSVTIYGGEFDSESANELILADGENATVVLNDGTYNKTAKSWLFGAATGKNISFIINGGIYNGYVNEPENTVDTIRPYDDPITVCGGTFNFDPTNWLAEGYKSTQNENGTWSVTAE